RGVYGLEISRRLTPVDIRVPGYPAFLAAIYVFFGESARAVMVAQALVGVLTCFVVAAMAAVLAPKESQRRVALAALWLAALCPFTANYTAAVLRGGIVVGFGALVRPETPLILAAAGAVLVALWWRPKNWRRLLQTGMLLAVGLILPLLPWAARNWRVVHTVQFLAPRYTELQGEFTPRGFYAWSGTWLWRFRDVYQ